MAASFCVFTTLIGGYELLNEQPVAAQSMIPFICLTDDPQLRSDGWQIRKAPTLFGMDSIRSQRALKLLPYDHLPEFDCSLYIDNSVLLSRPPEDLIEQFDVEVGMALGEHSMRQTVLDEFLVVVRSGRDDQSRVFEQLNHYLVDCPEVLDDKPLWTGLMLRDHRNARVRELMVWWSAHVQRYSRRDQLSLNYALRRTGLKPQILPINIRTSLYHSWPHSRERIDTLAFKSMKQCPPVAVIRQMETEQRALSREKNKLQRQQGALQKALAEQKRIVSRLRSSTSWRLAAPIRALARALRPDRTRQRAMAPPVQAPRALHVDPSDKRGHQLVQRNASLNPRTLQIWRQLLGERAWSHVLDVGANYGEMLLGARPPEGAKILAFEPNPLIAPYLEWNLADAGVNARIIRQAVTDRSGQARLLVDRDWSGTTALSEEQEEGKEFLTVRTTTISEVLGDVSAASTMKVLVKIDVEGHEASVLRGVMDLLESFEEFAALAELLHVPASDREWIIGHFDVEFLDKTAGDFVRVSPATADAFSAAMENDRLYPQDVVLRRKG